MQTSKDILVSDSDRACGPCTACCEGWLESKHLEMSPGVPCKHLCERGCSIYDERPEDPCRKFQCAWLACPDQFPEGMRPDLIGTIILRDRPVNNWETIALVPSGESVPDDVLQWMTDYASERQIPLIWHVWGKQADNFKGGKSFAKGPDEFLAVARWQMDSDDLLSL